MKINKYRQLFIASALLCISGTVAAETFSYTFISVSYELFSEDIDGISEDLEGDGINLDLSLDLTQNFALIASYATGSADVTSGGVTFDGDVDAASFGAFFHTPVDEKMDFVAGVQLIRGNVDLKVNGSSLPGEEADGNSVSVGIRAMIDKNVEVNGLISRTKIEDDSSTEISIGASYYVNKLFTIDARYLFDSDGKSLSFGATKYF
jgi:hypothetical protein